MWAPSSTALILPNIPSWGGTYKQYNGGQLVNDGVYTYASFTEESGAEREIKMVFVPDEGVLTYGYAWYNYIGNLFLINRHR